MTEEAEEHQSLQVSEVDGGSVVTDLSYNIRINPGSKLRRRWIVVNDLGCPAQLKEAGVQTSYKDSQYRFTQWGKMRCSVSIAAFEIRYVLYDVFGRHIKTLSSVTVVDLLISKVVDLGELGEWMAWENEVSSLHTVVSFVAHVRTAEGAIWRHKERAISTELERVELAASAEVLAAAKEK